MSCITSQDFSGNTKNPRFVPTRGAFGPTFSSVLVCTIIDADPARLYTWASSQDVAGT